MVGADEYRIAEVRICELSFECSDFGASLKLNTSLQKKLNIGEEIESKKCTILALATGAEWVAQGKPKRCPDRQMVDVLARGIRMGEITGAEQAQEQSSDENTRVGWGDQRNMSRYHGCKPPTGISGIGNVPPSRGVEIRGERIGGNRNPTE